MKKLIAPLLALVMVLSLAACGAKDAPPAPPKAEAGGETTLYLHMNAGVKKHEFVQSLADKYYEDTGIKVIVDASIEGSDYDTKNVLMMQDASNCPDIVLEDGILSYLREYGVTQDA